MVIGGAQSVNNNSSNGDALSTESIRSLLLIKRCRVLKRIPNGSRIRAADRLADTLQQVVDEPNNVTNWSNLLLFGFVCFGIPDERGGKRHMSNLPAKINLSINNFPGSIWDFKPRLSKLNYRIGQTTLASRVSATLEDGDIHT